MAKPLTIAGMTFASKHAAIVRCRDILNGGELGTEIAWPECELVEALFCARADKLINLHGLNVIRYLRDVQPGPFQRTRCFWAELEDGTVVDFSFMKALGCLAEIENAEL